MKTFRMSRQSDKEAENVIKHAEQRILILISEQSEMFFAYTGADVCVKRGMVENIFLRKSNLCKPGLRKPGVPMYIASCFWFVILLISYLSFFRARLLCCVLCIKFEFCILAKAYIIVIAASLLISILSW